MGEELAEVLGAGLGVKSLSLTLVVWPCLKLDCQAAFVKDKDLTPSLLQGVIVFRKKRGQA